MESDTGRSETLVSVVINDGKAQTTEGRAVCGNDDDDDDDDDKLTRCGQCGEMYTEPPRMLSCLHTFCLPCLQRFNVGPSPLVYL